MIQVGINPNVFIKSAVLDEKNTLAITFEEVADPNAPVIASHFDLLDSDEVTETAHGTTIRIFPPNPPKADTDKSQEKIVEMLTNDLNKTKGILIHLLSGWLTTDQLKGKFKMFESVPIDSDNFNTQIQKKEILDAAHKNLCATFVREIQPFLGKSDDPFRLLLVRQSADKHWASFRGRYIKENPFWESMKVPEDASKVAFTNYELTAGLNSGVPIPRTGAAATAAATAAPLTTANVFGK